MYIRNKNAEDVMRQVGSFIKKETPPVRHVEGDHSLDLTSTIRLSPEARTPRPAGPRGSQHVNRGVSAAATLSSMGFNAPSLQVSAHLASTGDIHLM